MTIFQYLANYGAVRLPTPRSVRRARLRRGHGALNSWADLRASVRSALVRLREATFEFLAPLESDASFASWWAYTSDAERRRAHVGRHRFDDATWRRRWAAYDTQWWPTLCTTGHASDMIEEPELPVVVWERITAILSARRLDCDPLTSPLQLVESRQRELELVS